MLMCIHNSLKRKTAENKKTSSLKICGMGNFTTMKTAKLVQQLIRD